MPLHGRRLESTWRMPLRKRWRPPRTTPSIAEFPISSVAFWAMVRRRQECSLLLTLPRRLVIAASRKFDHTGKVLVRTINRRAL